MNRANRQVATFGAGILVPATLFFVGVQAAFAHAILVHSSPADQSVVHNRSLTVTLDYNSRIEASRCTLTLTTANGQRLPLRMEPGAKPSELKAYASRLSNGKYTIQWQVLASDGHITRGNVAFTVAVK